MALRDLLIDLLPLRLKFVLLLHSRILLALDHLEVNLLLKQVNLKIVLLPKHLLIQESFLLTNEGEDFGPINFLQSELPSDVIKALVEDQQPVRVLVVKGLA
jgi:hypothetical protein